MKIRSQVGMVLNLDMHRSLHLSPVTCKTSDQLKAGIRVVQQRGNQAGSGLRLTGKTRKYKGG